MSSNNWVKYYKVNVPNRSGADRGFLRSFTGICGLEYPVLCKQVIPSTMVNLDIAHSIQLPPLASDTFANIDFNLEAFFVPTRILYGGYEAWQTGGKIRYQGDLVSPAIPVMSINFASANDLTLLGPGSLADFMGFRFTAADIQYFEDHSGDVATRYVGIFKFLAYHRVINDWYLRGNVQNFIFNHNLSSPGALENLPWYSFPSNTIFSLSAAFGDGVKLGQLRPRNFGSDYFTEAFVNAQAGNAPTIDISGTFDVVNAADLSGNNNPVYYNADIDKLFSGVPTNKINQSVSVQHKLTLAVIRAANSLTQYAERNQLPSPRMQDWVRAQYGANLEDGVAQRAMLLGSATFNVYTKGVEQNSMADGTAQPNNPFTSVGARYGNGFSTGNKHLIDHFTANEPGYIVVMACLTPKVRYATGVDKDNLRYNRQGSQVDLPNPILQNTGYEPIFAYELNGRDFAEANDAVFGYTDKYADDMVSVDQINGLLRSGESLESFALQRGFTSTPQISSSFLQIPSNYLKDIEAVSNQASGFDYWCDMFIDFKVSHPLNRYSIPTLQDPAYEHGHSVVMRRNGSRID